MAMTRSKIADIKQQLNKPLVKGEKWYLVDRKWFDQWKKYVNLDGQDESDTQEIYNPGPLDNSSILGKSGNLKPKLSEKEDYEVVPESVWNYFNQTFGRMPKQEPISRQVIDVGKDKEWLQLEIYPIDVELEHINNKNKQLPVTREFSRNSTLADVLNGFRLIYTIKTTTPVKIFEKESNGKLREITESQSSTLNDLCLSSGTKLSIQTANPDGSFPRIDARLTSSSNSVIALPSSHAEKTTGLTSSQMASSRTYGINTDASGSKGYQPGLCGLSNLGNTCFMNSILQSLSNIPPLTLYFLEKRYLEEINEDNPLGNHGEIARAYADLIRTIWSGQHSSYSPRQFKIQVGRFAPQFSNYLQHDSQELLTFLLDGLHEDLNRIKEKPYIELKDSDDRDDEIVAQEAWENYRKRNDSIIVDLFHGLLKSTVICPKCSKVSVTFDPFCTLSLPLPAKKEKTVEVHLVKEGPSQRPIRHRFAVPKAGNVRDLLEVVSKQNGVPVNELVVTEVCNSKFIKVYGPEDSIFSMTDRDTIYVYQLPCKIDDPSYYKICVYNREKKSTYGLLSPFGLPFIMGIKKSEATVNRLYEGVVKKMQRYFKNLDPKDKLWEDMVLLESSYIKKEELIDESENINEPMETEDTSQPGSSQNGEVEEAVKYPFCINRINSIASAVIGPLPDNDKLIDFNEDSFYISCDWTPSIRNICYDAEEAEKTVDVPNSTKGAIKRSSMYLKECLELYTTVEKLGADDAWYCPQCKEHQQATKKFDIWSLPDVLVIQLKRFSYNRYSRDKLDIFVEFPLRDLEMNPYVVQKGYRQSIYDLVCVSNHYGGLGSGHYTAYAKNKDDKRWYSFDDSSVSPVSSEDQVITKAGYVLFYVRRDPDSSHFNRPGITDVVSSSKIESEDEENSMDQC
ncbi:ubiquitin carboxyl-terminal hydrolase 15-like [Artemia franciscana]|uniref:ubiquitin carboxyl-terminal hydrolase 15-like n=1 Tax=Artemia franciscana TaxID=6661 RepID=UPI0032D9F283